MRKDSEVYRNKVKGKILKVVSMFEYGSKYVGLDDSYSDSDICKVYIPTVYALAFNEFKKGSKLDDNKDDAYYVSVNEYINLILEHNYESLCILLSSLESDDDFSKVALINLNNNLSEFIYGNIFKYAVKIQRELFNSIRESKKKGFNGKVLIKHFILINVLDKLNNIECYKDSFNLLVKENESIKLNLIEYKRLNDDDIKSLNYTEIKYFNNLGIKCYDDLLKYFDDKLEYFESKNKELLNFQNKYKDNAQTVINNVKEDISLYLLEQYKLN